MWCYGINPPTSISVTHNNGHDENDLQGVPKKVLPWTWLGKAWSGLVLVRNDHKKLISRHPVHMSFIDIHLVTSRSSWVFVLRSVRIPYFPWTRNLWFLKVCICSFFNDDEFFVLPHKDFWTRWRQWDLRSVGREGNKEDACKSFVTMAIQNFDIKWSNYEMYFINVLSSI